MSAFRMSAAGVAAAVLVATQAGCGSKGLASAALEAAGLRKPRAVSDDQAPRSIPLRLHASHKLNLDVRGQPLALAVRLYQLRDKEAFEHMPYAAFLDPQAERRGLGADLIEVREVMLVPGQRYEVNEKLGRETGYLALVALFQRPAEQRWRVALAASDAERKGLVVGLHACALSVDARGQAAMLSSVRCQ